MSVLHVIDSTGDTRTEWSSTDMAAIEAAEQVFKDVKKKGYLAYSTKADGSGAEVIKDFDRSAERIVMSPQLVGG